MERVSNTILIPKLNIEAISNVPLESNMVGSDALHTIIAHRFR